MQLSTLLSSAIFATTVLGAPRSRLSRRGQEVGQSKPPASILSYGTSDAFAGSITNNWSGAVFVAPPSDDTFNSITGTFSVPTINQGDHSEAAFWIGIDGYNLADLIQAGVDLNVGDDGSASYQAWYEWLPESIIYIDSGSFAVNAGDVVTVTVNVEAGATDATAIFSNQNGASFSQPFSQPDGGAPSTGTTAEWVSERTTKSYGFDPLLNFGTVVFSGLNAGLTSGGSADLNGLTSINMVRDPNGDQTVLATGSFDAGAGTITTVWNAAS